tara:strand:- start:135183 stop:135329 length:147 start_codon:yes stop_codon:yes gene_type:complete
MSLDYVLKLIYSILTMTTKQLIDSLNLAKPEVSGTSLITLYIPAGADL